MNRLIRDAVLTSRSKAGAAVGTSTSDADLNALEEAREHEWSLPVGAEVVGHLLTKFGKRFSNLVLTTNFDPLIEIGINKAGGDYFRTALATDGNLLAGAGTVPHVVHLHGYWYGSETLHTPEQLTRSRPLLESSLRTLLRDKTIVVGGTAGGMMSSRERCCI